MSAYIELTNLSKTFTSKGVTNHVLNNINLQVEQGEFIAIIGFSGSGKSTLLSMIAGLLLPDDSHVKMDGGNILSPHPDRGVVFQNYSLLPWLTVYENILLAVDEIFPTWTKQKRAEHTQEYVDMVKLSHAAHKFPSQLSGGMRQRVSVARGLATRPKILLLDEPLSALDALTRANLQDEISDIWAKNKTTVIWITNDPDEAILLADRVIPLLPHKNGATLGRAFCIDIERPRGRKQMLVCPRFQTLKNEIISTLNQSKYSLQTSTIKKLPVPDILPEDLNVRRSTIISEKLEPRRRSQLITEDHLTTHES